MRRFAIALCGVLPAAVATIRRRRASRASWLTRTSFSEASTLRMRVMFAWF
jgi:hypothetical protein